MKKQIINNKKNKVSLKTEITKNRIMVTGAAGFIGSHLCEKLLNDYPTAEIYAIDNLYSGKLLNILPLFKSRRFKFYEQDIIQPIQLEVDQIYHLACPASPVTYQKDPIFTLKTSFLGSLNLLELAKNLKIPILLASTSEVYGDPLENPQTENYFGNVNPVGIRSCYDEGKRVMEALAMDYLRAHRLQVKIIRIFNTYGPRMAFDDGRVVSNFIFQALTTKDITVYGNGQQTRSFCYVLDLVSGIIKMMQHRNLTGPVNLGNPAEITIAELAKLVLKLTKSKSRIVNKTLPQDDPRKRRPDISLAREKLNWQPSVALIDGLLATIESFKQRLAES